MYYHLDCATDIISQPQIGQRSVLDSYSLNILGPIASPFTNALTKVASLGIP